MKGKRIFSLNVFVYCLLFTVFVSCAKKKVEIPQNVLGRDSIIPILVDVHIAQAAVGNFNAADSVRYNINDYLPYILKIHHITKAQYDTSIAFYTGHPELMKDIYDQVINELSKKQGEVSAH